MRALLPQDVTVLFGWVDFVPGSTDRAAGYAVGKARMLIRDGLDDAADLSLEATLYTILHESLGHISLAQVPISDEQQRRALVLLDAGSPLPQFSDPDEVWRQAPGDAAKADALGTIKYWLRPFECIIDDMVASITDGLQSAWSRKYRRRVTDRRALKSLWVERRAAQVPGPADPPETDPTDPLPNPPDPCEDEHLENARLRAARVAVANQLEVERAAHDATRGLLAAAEARIEMLER